MTSTAVVILNYNGAHLLQQFLPGVIKHSPQAQIVVADNASTDESREVVLKNFPAVKLIALDKNYGFSGGYNRALQQIDATYCVLLNSDVDVTEGWLQPMVELLDKHPDIAAVQPKILACNNREFLNMQARVVVFSMHWAIRFAAGGYLITWKKIQANTMIPVRYSGPVAPA